jgi:hypothetical protein
MSMACSTNGGDCWESWKERDHLVDKDVGEWTILKWILKRKNGMVWIDLAQGRDQCMAVVNTVMNIRVP